MQAIDSYHPAVTPVLIGITGKRALQGQDDTVRASLRAAFERIDKATPHTPKVLLSALASGADTIAAEEALGRSAWRVIAPLPLAQALYVQDFSTTEAETFRKLLADPKVKSFELPALNNDSTGAPFDGADLARGDHAKNTARTDHYEQVGLFIADRSDLVIAVMPADEKPGSVGGTARIFSYRLHGPVDAKMEQTLRASVVLTPPEPLDDPKSGPIWLIDPRPQHQAKGQLPFKVLLPDWWSARRGAARSPGASLLLVRRLDAFHRVLQRTDSNPPKDRAQSSDIDASSVLRSARDALSATQVEINRKVRRSIYALALFFIVAVIGFESFVALAWRWGILVYLGSLMLAMALYFIARHRLWQAKAEDYRAVAEALRVQLAWWDAGLTGPACRVDRFYLRSSRGSLRLVRHAIGHIVNAALLVARPPRPAPGGDLQWVQGQQKFFVSRIAVRRRRLAVVQALSWFLFIGALAPAALVAAHACWSHAVIPAVTDRMPHSIWVVIAVAVAGAVFLFFARSLLALSSSALASGPSGAHASHRSRLRTPDLLSSFLGGITISVGALAFAPMLAHGGSHAEGSAEHLALLTSIVMAALAGALRFVAEKLSWESEVHGYEDTLEVFHRAELELKRISAEAGLQAAGCRARQEIVFALGKEALEENEAWLKAHRERPLEPVLGA